MFETPSQTLLYLALVMLACIVIACVRRTTKNPKATYKPDPVLDPYTRDEGRCGGAVASDPLEADEIDVTERADADIDPEEEAIEKETTEGATPEEEVAETSASLSPLDAEEGEAPSPSESDRPTTLLDAPRDGHKDNLTRIKGIGVKIEELLNGVGIYHFDQIAAWTEEEAQWIDHHLSFPGRAKRDDWIGQAMLLAEGEGTPFSKRVDAGEVATSKHA